jgi:hypothetical protein
VPVTTHVRNKGKVNSSIYFYLLFAGWFNALQLRVRSHRRSRFTVEQHVGHHVVGDFGPVVTCSNGCACSRPFDEKQQDKTSKNMIGFSRT